jgi:hypothetical protein
MNNAYKIIRYFSSTKTIPVGSYRFTNKDNINRLIKDKKINIRIIGATESHALPIKINETKISIYKDHKDHKDHKENKENKENKIPQFTDKEFDDLMKIIS